MRIISYIRLGGLILLLSSIPLNFPVNAVLLKTTIHIASQPDNGQHRKERKHKMDKHVILIYRTYSNGTITDSQQQIANSQYEKIIRAPTWKSAGTLYKEALLQIP